MPIRTSEAEWRGNLREGAGRVKLGSGAFEGSYSFPSRFEEGKGTNPEELLGAAHAACYSMALSAGLSKAGPPPTRVHTVARVHLEKVGDGFAITHSALVCVARVPDIDDKTFQEIAEQTKSGCPVSKVLNAKISLAAKLVS